MTTTYHQDQIFGRDFCPQIIEWIGNNLNPDEVFEEKALKEWAKSASLNPDEIFSDSELYDWATSHGMVNE